LISFKIIPYQILLNLILVIHLDEGDLMEKSWVINNIE